MKHALGTLGILFLLAIPSRAATRDELWKRVDLAVSQGLPRTALTNLEPIIVADLRDKAWADATKAIARKIVLEAQIQGNKPEERITRMQAEMAKAPLEIVPLLRTIQADWWWQYFLDNRWRFLRRTGTTESSSTDFTTWDLPRLFREIGSTFDETLSHADALKATRIEQFNDLLSKGTLPDSYRPTLYDFIAYEALKFYSSGEAAAARPEDAFELPAESPVFGTPDAFLLWNPPATDTNAPAFKAVRLFQDLLRFHKNDRDPSAFLDADLARLGWAYNSSSGENKSILYKAALQHFVDQWPDKPIVAMALHTWAQLLQEEGELIEARRLAIRGEQAYPQSPGGMLCHNIIQGIEGKSINITTERVWNAPWPKIVVRYRNISSVSFRMIAWDWNEFLERRHRRPEALSESDQAELLRKSPALEWSAKLSGTPDFNERIEELPSPTTLKPGFYFIVASHDPKFGSENNQVSFTDVWVSDLALVVISQESPVQGLVLNANTGEPIAGAKVTGWYLDAGGNRVENGVAQTTDAKGWFGFPIGNSRPLLLRAQALGQELGSMQEYNSWIPGEPQPNDQIIFFTDRSIYRPGQTVSFKGIAVRVDQAHDKYEPISGGQIEVTFLDPNGKEVSRSTHRSNGFGSFSGSFTAPRNRVLGQYRLQSVKNANGAAFVSVEEYKRPKFQVKLEAPKVAPKLRDSVNLEGKAEAYTGAAVDGAGLHWRVVREVRWPIWWSPRYLGWSGSPGIESQEIAHGVAQTESDGRFKVTFIANPDSHVDERSEASFNFHIYADVTDTAGETRSADRQLNVGFVALRATATAEAWQIASQPVTVSLWTTTLDDEPQAAEGSLKIYRLKQPDQVERAWLPNLPRPLRNPKSGTDEPLDLSNPSNWPEGEVVLEKSWTTDSTGKGTLTASLSTGVYRAELDSQDRYGKKVTGRSQFIVLDPRATTLALRVPNLLTAPRWELEPGAEFTAIWGTGYSSGRAFVEIEHRGKFVQRSWTKPGVTQEQIKLAVDESMRGGFTLHVTQIRENRAYFHSQHVDVPWKNKELELSWEHFVSKLKPGQKETWSAVIKPRRTNAMDLAKENGGDTNSTPGSEKRFEQPLVEMAATLYDESLDQFRQHSWLRRFEFFREDYAQRNTDFANIAKPFQQLRGEWSSDYRKVDLRYREFPEQLMTHFWVSPYRMDPRLAGRYGLLPGIGAQGGSAPSVMSATSADSLGSLSLGGGLGGGIGGGGGGIGGGGGMARREISAKAAIDFDNDGANASPNRPMPNLSQITARRNLNETAFFFPQLTSDSNGIVRMTFTMPEALTQWRFLAFAHDAALRSGFLEDHAVTSKEIMVQPNPPRFLREGDVLEFTVKVSNQSAARQTGAVRLTFASAETEENADARLGNKSPEHSFDIPAKESRSFSWRITVPDGTPFLVYKTVASTGRLSDGEEGFLPVLSRRVLVTESIPLPIRVKAGEGEVKKSFAFTKLLQSAQSKSLVNENLVVQMVSNPAWYAVLALPYLMEFPHECTEQTFNRLYANTLARTIANSDPKIRRIFDLWKNTVTLDAPLEKNQDLKSVILDETPWLRQAQNENQARKDVGVLFDENRLNSEVDQILRKLTQAQLEDGSWPWFPGGRGNDYITLYIVTGFGRLRHLGADLDVRLAQRALSRLDAAADQRYRDILRGSKPQDYVPSPTDALYLYGRSFFQKELPVAPQYRDALGFYLRQSRNHWLKLGNRQSQGHLALALKRWGGGENIEASQLIMRSIKERSVQDEELGMYWRDLEATWWWYRAPIETQALMIEAFDEVLGDKDAVEECRAWLLKQKQTQDWKTTKATADAVYALLLRGKDLLSSTKLTEVTLAGMNLAQMAQEPANSPTSVHVQPPTEPDGKNAGVEPGTGFYEVRFKGSDIKPAMGEISVRKSDEGVAWGSVNWQYLEDIGKVTPHEGTPLSLKKSLYLKINTKSGPSLAPLKSTASVGDELVVRIELRTDRDMEYLHLKDQRGSGTEPMNVLSQYRYQDGLAYYETTRDTASHFFIDYLPKGTYVFEYPVRIQHRGRYQTGLASVQCMYAPEYNSHSESFDLTVQ